MVGGDSAAALHGMSRAADGEGGIAAMSEFSCGIGKLGKIDDSDEYPDKFSCGSW